MNNFNKKIILNKNFQNENFIINNFVYFIISFILCITFGYIYIYIAKKYNFIQKKKNIEKLIYKKIPTSGGIFILLSAFLTSFLYFKNNINNFFIFFSSAFLYGILGFIDDYIKVYKKNIGISIKIKFIFQTLISIFISFLIYINKYKYIYKYKIFIPFLGDIFLYKNKIIFMLAIYIILISLCNSVNITDGLDGLSSKIIINMLIYIIISNYLNKNNIININDKIYILNTCFTLLGSIIGFLWFNSYPSNVFMGDVGSLSLGSLLAIIYVMSKKEFMLLITGFILIIETLSVIIQIISYKLFKKRVFNISPIHHNYIYNKVLIEPKLVNRFTIISIFFSIIAIILSL